LLLLELAPSRLGVTLELALLSSSLGRFVASLLQLRNYPSPQEFTLLT
jgi:hypothetical protein